MPGGIAPAQPLLVAAIHWGAVLPLCLSSLAIMGSPGPATVSLVAAGSAYGVRRSVPYLIGIVLGTIAVLAAVASGVTVALLAAPAVATILLALSAAYIVWLAYHIAVTPPLAVADHGSAAPSLAGGALLGVANPKAWVACAAVFASVRLADGATADATVKLAVLSAMVVVIMVGWLLAGISLAPLLRDRRRARVVNAALAAALIAAVALAIVD